MDDFTVTILKDSPTNEKRKVRSNHLSKWERIDYRTFITYHILAFIVRTIVLGRIKYTEPSFIRLPYYILIFNSLL